MKRLILAAVLALACLPALADGGAEPFVGRWALDLPGNAAGWLEVKQQDGWLDGSVLWGGGSVLPLDSVYLEDGTLRAARGNTVERKLPDGAVRSQFVSDLYAFTVQGDTISGTRVSPRSDGTGVASVKVTGKRIPPLPPAPLPGRSARAPRAIFPVIEITGKENPRKINDLAEIGDRGARKVQAPWPSARGAWRTLTARVNVNGSR